MLVVESVGEQREVLRTWKPEQDVDPERAHVRITAGEDIVEDGQDEFRVDCQEPSDGEGGDGWLLVAGQALQEVDGLLARVAVQQRGSSQASDDAARREVVRQAPGIILQAVALEASQGTSGLDAQLPGHGTRENER